MHNLALPIILAEQRRPQCPCGAVADRPHGLCRKCQSRDAWRRKSGATHRKSARRRTGRRAVRVARFSAHSLNSILKTGIGTED
jgi:hypothetical protein